MSAGEADIIEELSKASGKKKKEGWWHQKPAGKEETWAVCLEQRGMQAVPGDSEGIFTSSRRAAALICISVTFMTAS